MKRRQSRYFIVCPLALNTPSYPSTTGAEFVTYIGDKAASMQIVLLLYGDAAAPDALVNVAV